MNTYRRSPQSEMDAKDLTAICKERIELYKILEEVKLENFEIGSQKWSDYIKSKIKENNLKTYLDLLTDEESSSTFKKSQKKDNIAHWMLGLGYCDTEELQNVFVTWELQWFYLIFMNSSEQARNQFLIKNNLIYKEVSHNDIIDHGEEIEACLGCDCSKIPKLYQIHWTEIPEVVGVRKAYLFMGETHFLPENIVYCVKRKLKNEFFESLMFQKENFHKLKDQRQTYFIKSLPLIVPRKHYNIIDGVSLSNIDELAKTHYPLCMRHLHRLLRQEHHLKYDGKMQYGIFLYYLGLPYEDAMQLWREEFTKKIGVKLFNAKYQYLFKHQYGRVGRKYEYPSSTCQYIINYRLPMYQQTHGCPFKHWSTQKLRDTLEQDCHGQDIGDIEDLVREGKYQRACTKYLCKTKNIHEGKVATIDSPNGYVQISIKESSDCLDSLFSMGKI